MAAFLPADFFALAVGFFAAGYFAPPGFFLPKIASYPSEYPFVSCNPTRTMLTDGPSSSRIATPATPSY